MKTWWFHRTIPRSINFWEFNWFFQGFPCQRKDPWIDPWCQVAWPKGKKLWTRKWKLNGSTKQLHDQSIFENFMNFSRVSFAKGKISNNSRYFRFLDTLIVTLHSEDSCHAVITTASMTSRLTSEHVPVPVAVIRSTDDQAVEKLLILRSTVVR